MEIDLREFFKSIDLTDKRILAAAERGMQKVTDDLLQESRKLAPEEDGDLRNEAHTEVEAKDGRVTGAVVYATKPKRTKAYTANFSLALYLHEHRPFKDPTTPGTKPKFLEQPMKRKAERYLKMIADEIAKEL
ncbi:hypothetical protein [Paenibacillus sp. MBLB4367]|uniref:hypothetical protein n=1 Tax=Paenibacillus sp. MBLB4367 TaxID=3384767 RepID=UPI00390812E2